MKAGASTMAVHTKQATPAPRPLAGRGAPLPTINEEARLHTSIWLGRILYGLLLLTQMATAFAMMYGTAWMWVFYPLALWSVYDLCAKIRTQASIGGFVRHLPVVAFADEGTQHVVANETTLVCSRGLFSLDIVSVVDMKEVRLRRLAPMKARLEVHFWTRDARRRRVPGRRIRTEIQSPHLAEIVTRWALENPSLTLCDAKGKRVFHAAGLTRPGARAAALRQARWLAGGVDPTLAGGLDALHFPENDD